VIEMDIKIRTTLVTLMPRGVKAEDTLGFIDKVIAGEDPTMLHTLYRDGTNRRGAPIIRQDLESAKRR